MPVVNSREAQAARRRARTFSRAGISISHILSTPATPRTVTTYCHNAQRVVGTECLHFGVTRRDKRSVVRGLRSSFVAGSQFIASRETVGHLTTKDFRNPCLYLKRTRRGSTWNRVFLQWNNIYPKTSTVSYCRLLLKIRVFLNIFVNKWLGSAMVKI